MTDTPPEPKATEPSDASDDELEEMLEAGERAVTALQKCREAIEKVSDGGRYRKGFEAGLLFRAAEVEALKAKLARAVSDGLAACDERDKLHAAIAWYAWQHWPYTNCHARCWVDNSSGATEAHDGTPAGRAAALVRLFERCGDGTNR